MTDYLEIVLPLKNPAFDFLKAGYYVVRGNELQTAFLVPHQISIFALSRLLVAGALYVAIDRMGMNKAVSSLAIGVVSIPALIVYWGGKAVYLGGQMTYKALKLRIAQELAKGLGLYLIGVQALRYHNLMTKKDSHKDQYSKETAKQTARYGALEWFLFNKLAFKPNKVSYIVDY